MRVIKYPPYTDWKLLTERPMMNKAMLNDTVREILYKVKTGGDTALLELSEKYDGIRPKKLRVDREEIASAAAGVPQSLKEAVNTAAENIRNFHSQVIKESAVVETIAGVRCWSRQVAIENAGLYVPGGTVPLFSTLLMLAIPASVAGCSKIIVCTPPSADDMIDPLLLYCASVSGVTDIYRAGGAQAVAAMAYGTETIPRVDKVFGPGNQYVTRAKELVQADGVAIDMPAGPSELLIIADRYANQRFVAADLLSQAEHGIDSQVMLLTDDANVINMVRDELDCQLNRIPRKSVAGTALKKSTMIIMRSLDECVSFSNSYAPEHLIIATENPSQLAREVTHAGSVFLGRYSCESLGDYAAGPNHTLPTNGFARSYSGITAESFMKKIFFQEVTAEGILNLGPTVELLAAAEKLDAHVNAVTVRLNELSNVRY